MSSHKKTEAIGWYARHMDAKCLQTTLDPCELPVAELGASLENPPIWEMTITGAPAPAVTQKNVTVRKLGGGLVGFLPYNVNWFMLRALAENKAWAVPLGVAQRGVAIGIFGPAVQSLDWPLDLAIWDLSGTRGMGVIKLGVEVIRSKWMEDLIEKAA